jgi:maltooligosyltrehalose trehalohydrolase
MTALIDKDRNQCCFEVWAPFASKVCLHVLGPEERVVPMEAKEKGHWQVTVEGILHGCLYLYRLEGRPDRPDPSSHSQPQGVHGPSQVINHADFDWHDGEWKGPLLQDYLIYELHVGTFTREGTFDAIIPRLDYLRDLGVTALELMPVAQFPGTRNWGYDGVYPYAPQASYGGPRGLKMLVDACHGKGLAVILDVVYNHLGPEGNYLGDFGPYFTRRYSTPWGDAINFDGQYSDEVRRFFIDNSLYWMEHYHMDGVRIDAIHRVYDFSARHFLSELANAVRMRGITSRRNNYIIVESDLNDVRVLRPKELGGHGIDAQWNDDFHHSVHALITGEHAGYYQDFGAISHLVKAFAEGFVYSGQYSRYRKRSHGSSSEDRPAWQFIVFSQNHDHVGNRLMGDRLSGTQEFEKLKLAAGAVLFSPFIPLLFMGEEYGETSPFHYFVSHSDEALIEAVRRGRQAEFSAFEWKGKMADPQAEETFLASKINHERAEQGQHQTLLRFYRSCIVFRRERSALRRLSKETLDVTGSKENKTLFIRRWCDDDEVILGLSFNETPSEITGSLPAGSWTKLLDSSCPRWDGPGETATALLMSRGEEVRLALQPFSVVLYGRGLSCNAT